MEENLSVSFSKLREYSSWISALRRKNSCRSCSSWIRDSDCCSRHLNCSTSWLRISVHSQRRRKDSKICSHICWKGFTGVQGQTVRLHRKHLPLELSQVYATNRLVNQLFIYLESLHLDIKTHTSKHMFLQSEQSVKSGTEAGPIIRSKSPNSYTSSLYELL